MSKWVTCLLCKYCKRLFVTLKSCPEDARDYFGEFWHLRSVVFLESENKRNSKSDNPGFFPTFCISFTTCIYISNINLYGNTCGSTQVARQLTVSNLARFAQHNIGFNDKEISENGPYNQIFFAFTSMSIIFFKHNIMIKIMLMPSALLLL